ncbi:MAG TPA: hypothetical protein VL486_03180 [Verrucomicrobiae bacterium]|nr:hypothetical protein [Verrucomicrobiae bacterium]
MSTSENGSDSSETFLRVNATTNAIDYLESAAHFLERKDDFKWKWIALATYHALYAFCVVALEHGDPDWVLSARGKTDDEGGLWKSSGQKRWSKSKRRYLDANKAAYRIEWVETDEEPPEANVPDDPFAWTKGKLIGFWTALARIQDKFWMGRYVHSKPVTIADDELKVLQWLGLKVRNELIHFVPKHWSIGIRGIQCGCLAAVRIIEFLAFESNNIWLIDGDGRSRITQAIGSLRTGLSTKDA